MKKIDLNYSPKDTPAHLKQAYFIKMFTMTNSFLNKIRLAACWFEKRIKILKIVIMIQRIILTNIKIFFRPKHLNHNPIIYSSFVRT